MYVDVPSLKRQPNFPAHLIGWSAGRFDAPVPASRDCWGKVKGLSLADQGWDYGSQDGRVTWGGHEVGVCQCSEKCLFVVGIHNSSLVIINAKPWLDCDTPLRNNTQDKATNVDDKMLLHHSVTPLDTHLYFSFSSLLSFAKLLYQRRWRFERSMMVSTDDFLNLGESVAYKKRYTKRNTIPIFNSNFLNIPRIDYYAMQHGTWSEALIIRTRSSSSLHGRPKVYIMMLCFYLG